MTPVLDDLLNDDRLARLFSNDVRHCALQLWILQIKSEQTTENRVVYGRLLPYNYSDNHWYASDDDNFQTFEQFQAQVIRLNLYIKNIHCRNLLQLLSAGRTISAISEELELILAESLKTRLGATALVPNGLVYRPVAYLLNRDAYVRQLSSPHGAAGAISASISQADKGALFRLGQDYNVALTASTVKHLNADTGLSFGGTDAVRFGDLELLVFPALDDDERSLLSVDWVAASCALIAKFNPMQVPHFNCFQFRLNISNGGQIAYARIATAERDTEGIFECKFELSDQLRARIDSTELEIFGFHDDLSQEGTLCCRRQIGYIREIHFQSHVVGHGSSPVKFDWLEKTTRPAASARVQAALTINRDPLGFTSHIGERKADPWVPVNRDLVSLFERLHPPKSGGLFFQRWGPSGGEGRLQFVEWFRTLLAKYQQHQIVIFDPYFEAAGLGLVLRCATQKSDYIVFTSLARPSREGEAILCEVNKPTEGRINNLMTSCERSCHLLDIKLRIYGLRDGRLHDRYILIMGSDGLPVAGFNLSNSLQTIAENYPLLVTPIPPDTLLQVEQYKTALVREAKVTQSEDEAENPSMRLLFDSTVSSSTPRRYEPLRFLEKAKAGDVLSILINEPLLQSLSGDPLKKQMAALELLKDGSLRLPKTADLRNCLSQQVDNFTDFTATWEVLGEVLAHSSAGDSRFRELESERNFMEFLARFLKASFNRMHDDADRQLTVIDTWFFRAPIETLIHRSFHPHHLFHTIKPAALTWTEYYTIKFLWWYAPDALLEIAEAELNSVPSEPQSPDIMRLSLLSQIVNEIALSLEFDISVEQRDRLIRSENGLLQWMGLNAIEMLLEKPDGLATVLQLMTGFANLERVRTLGWMVNRAARNQEKDDVYRGLVVALHEALPATISAEELRHLVDSMRGHMWKLTWTEPWLFKDVIYPLLQSNRINANDACEIWMQDLLSILKPQSKTQPRSFDRAREGQTTNATAYLFACSSSEQQQVGLKMLQNVLKRQQRVIQQPLASTSDWSRWDDALTISLWILAFGRWGEYHLRLRDMTNHKLEVLSRDAHNLAMVRPMDDWRTDGVGRRYELAAFLEQVEDLLAE
jgi:hypothetical protein